ncbi:2-isopropylmalate synthase [Waltera sp.]|uniref:2-isopropylmalate synthase n=1 Tax=Waltera sp. TaxID=2815806 RepID=UPI003AB2142A
MNSADIAAKYQKTYFMPPEVTYDWVKKDSITKPPIWCSVDLRDGNQALIDPMSLEDKLEFFKLLVKIGFREIEVGFPASSDTEYNFIRALIERDMIPNDVTIQVLTQAREHIIRKTFEAVKGAPHAVIHLYNSTSVEQREQVFKKDKEAIKKLAVDGAQMLKNLADETEGNFTFEYSPESFSQTEVDYALEVCNAVLEVWKPTADRKAIINLPTTVQVAMPHVFACQVEYMHKHLKYRENVVLSVHPHNDRGCGISDAEFGVLAGADRVEGTLFGNGERTGNVDLVTVALNMMCHGVDSGLDFSHIMEIREAYENFTGMKVHERVPYAGDLVFTAFSGSHQDAISKGMQALQKRNDGIWEVPYLPIDPSDIGREYEPVVRINSQSGKGGVAFVMDSFYGFRLPKGMHKEFADIIQKIAEKQGEVAPEQIMDEFRANYLDRKEPMHFKKCQITDKEYEGGAFATVATLTFTAHDTERTVEGVGNGPIDAVQRAIEEALGIEIRVLDYNEHALRSGSGAQAASYIHLMDVKSGRATYGVGISSNITRASIRGIFSAVNRLFY